MATRRRMSDIFKQAREEIEYTKGHPREKVIKELSACLPKENRFGFNHEWVPRETTIVRDRERRVA